MKKKIAVITVSIIAVIVLVIIIFPKKEKIHVEDVLALYSEIELTTENFDDYYEFVEFEEKDIFGEVTQQKIYQVKERPGYITHDPVLLRLNVLVTTIKYPVSTEKPQLPIEAIEESEYFVNSFEDVCDLEFYGKNIGMGTDIRYMIPEERGDGYIYEEIITECTVEKVIGSVITYDSTSIDELFITDEDGNRYVDIWYNDKFYQTCDEDLLTSFGGDLYYGLHVMAYKLSN